MFESIRKKIKVQNRDNSPKNMSFDFKLMFVYHITIMVLFGTGIIDSAVNEALLALVLGVVLLTLSVLRKIKSKWKWPGIGILSVPSAVLFQDISAPG